ncbi:MAG: hypothetical protein LQ340_002276 [Diploschistes diacapsis]|nr:MAG: hypothetical protein LQ340_002276 [Diploschistes diacapsis]
MSKRLTMLQEEGDTMDNITKFMEEPEGLSTAAVNEERVAVPAGSKKKKKKSKKSNGSEPAPGFLDLPLELRFQIYHEALLSHLPIGFVVEPNFASKCHEHCEIQGPKSPGLAIFRVSRAINVEATQYFYGHLKFKVTDTPYCQKQTSVEARDCRAFHACTVIDFKPFLTTIGRRNCASIRQLKIMLSRRRFLEEEPYRRTGTSTLPGPQFLTGALELLAASNTLNSLEIHFENYRSLSSFFKCKQMMQQLREFSGINHVKLTLEEPYDPLHETVDAHAPEMHELEEFLKTPRSAVWGKLSKCFEGHGRSPSKVDRETQKYNIQRAYTKQAVKDIESRETFLKRRERDLKNESAAIKKALKDTAADKAKLRKQTKRLDDSNGVPIDPHLLDFPPNKREIRGFGEDRSEM